MYVYMHVHVHIYFYSLVDGLTTLKRDERRDGSGIVPGSLSSSSIVNLLIL